MEAEEILEKDENLKKVDLLHKNHLGTKALLVLEGVAEEDRKQVEDLGEGAGEQGGGVAQEDDSRAKGHPRRQTVAPVATHHQGHRLPRP